MASLFHSVENDLDRSRTFPWKSLPEISKEEYTWEKLEAMSNGWRTPVLVRGLFANASALHWTVPMLADLFQTGQVNVLRNNSIEYANYRACPTAPLDGPYGSMKPFNETLFRVANQSSLESIILPPASRAKRVKDTGVNDNVEARWDLLVAEDLDLIRLGGNFLAFTRKGPKNVVLTQMFAANGRSDMVTGSGWHCDVCNNFIVQVMGRKRWYFVDSHDSIYMRPTMPGGKTAIAGGNAGIEQATIPYLQEKYVVDVEPGDFMYNPEFFWHTVENYPGFSIGVVSRECHLYRNFRANPVFSSAILMNHLWAALTEHEARIRILGIFGGFTPDVPVVKSRPGSTVSSAS